MLQEQLGWHCLHLTTITITISLHPITRLRSPSQMDRWSRSTVTVARCLRLWISSRIRRASLNLRSTLSTLECVETALRQDLRPEMPHGNIITAPDDPTNTTGVACALIKKADIPHLMAKGGGQRRRNLGLTMVLLAMV